MENMEVIYAYTRADALNDGVLIDVSEHAKELGFRVPVAVTSALYGGYITPPRSNEVESIEGRLHDTLWMLLVEIRRNRGGNTIIYTVRYGRKNVRIKAISGPGDHMEHVITIMLEDED